MIARHPLSRRLLADESGAIAIEFGLLGPLLIAMLLGVLQVGIAMQSYNAIRNVSADVARYAAVQYQTDNLLTNNQIRQYTISTAVSSPYLLQRSGLWIEANDATTQRVTGAREITLSIDYQVPSILTLMGFNSPSITFERPIFVLD